MASHNKSTYSRKTRVAVYIRVSTDEQADKNTQKTQEEVIRAYVESRSSTMEFAGDDYRFYDDGISGTIDMDDRPALSQLIDMVRNVPAEYLPFDTVIVYRLDRFARNLLLMLMILDEFQSKGIGFITTEQDIDTTSIGGKMMLALIGTFAEMERALIKERTWDGISRRLAEGMRRNTIYGYTKNTDKRPEIHKEQAEVVKSIFERYTRDRRTVGEIAKELTKRRIQVPGMGKGKRSTDRVVNTSTIWQNNSVRQILNREVYTGKYYYGKTQKIYDPKKKGPKLSDKYEIIRIPESEWKLSPVSHEPIITEMMFKAAQEITKQAGDVGRRGQEGAKRYLLSPYLRCDYCKEHRYQSGMSHRKGTKSNGMTFYMCGKKSSVKNKGGVKCTVIPVGSDYLDKLVLERIKSIFNNPKVIAGYLDGANSKAKHRQKNEKELLRIENEILKQDGVKSRANELYINAAISYEEHKTRIADVDKYIKELIEQKKFVQDKLEGIVEAEKYIMTFEALKELVTANMDKYFADEKKVAVLFNALIREIVIYSRPADSTDKVVGRKPSPGVVQAVPYHVKIVFKLPQEILAIFIKGDDDELWGGGDHTKGPKKGPSVWNGPSGMLFRDKAGIDHPYPASGDDGIDWESGTLKQSYTPISHFSTKNNLSSDKLFFCGNKAVNGSVQ